MILALWVITIVVVKILGVAGIGAFFAGWFSPHWIIALTLGLSFGAIDAAIVWSFSITPVLQAVIAVIVGAAVSLLTFRSLGRKRLARKSQQMAV